MTYRWNIQPSPDAGSVADLARRSEVPRVLAEVLLQRGYDTPEAVDAFLAPDLTTGPDPSMMKGIPEAVARIRRAVQQGERVRVHGDYDVDGVTSSALLVRVLRSMDANVDAHIPHRSAEGYGLSLEAVDRARDDGVKLIITVDCGVTALAEARRAAEVGVDLIVTDHHTPADELPEAVAVVNPRQEGCGYPFKDLAGVGIAYKLAAALNPPSSEPHLLHLLDLVALGTTADVVPLRGENRVFTKYGLAQFARTRWPGLDALLDRIGVRREGISAGQIVFNVAPRINAAGRMADATEALQLLLTDDAFEAAELAASLDRQNSLRREADEETLRLALRLIEEQGGVADRRALVLYAEDWHPGVIGIVASRLVERFHLPTVLVSFAGDQGRGSGRSIDGFDLYDALASCAEHLEEFGGHRHAAGLTLTREKRDAFVAAFEELAGSRLTDEDLQPVLDVDATVSLEDLDEGLLQGLKKFEPFGAKNRRPTFLARGAVVHGTPRRVGSDRSHLRFSVRRDGRSPLDVIGFGLGDRLGDLASGRADLVFAFEENDFRGVRRPQIRLKDLRPAVA